MAISITNPEYLSAGNNRGFVGSITLDSSYADGGESLTPADLGVGRLQKVEIESTQAYDFVYDYSNEKVIAYRTVTEAPLIVEEVVTVTTDVGTLSEIPAYIVSIEDSTNGNVYRVLPVANTGIDNTSVAVSFVTGVMTFAAADNPPTVKVTYFPQRDGTLFSSANLVIDETVTAAGAGVNLANRAALVQYIYNTTNTAFMTEEQPNATASATGKIVLDIANSSNTRLETHADDNGDTLTVTYLKFSGLDSSTQFIDDTDIVLSSEAYNFTGNGNFNGLVVPGYGTRLVAADTSNNDELANWSGPGDTATELIATWHPAENRILTNNSTAITNMTISWIILAPALMKLGGKVEVAPGTNLSAVTVRIEATGQ